MKFRITLLALTILFPFLQIHGQFQDGSSYRGINTAVPFLLLSPDARGTGLGTTGVASAPDAFSMHWNPAKYAFTDKRYGFAISYTPWYYLMIKDYDPLELPFGFNGYDVYFKIKERFAIGTSMMLYSLGEITFTDEYGDDLGTYKMYELYNDVSFSYRICEAFSVGLSGRFIYSNLTAGQFVQGAETIAGTSIAADVAAYYHKEIDIGNLRSEFSCGINISNIGNKISYSETAIRKDFIPTNLRLGAGLKMNFNERNSLTALVDFNKLLVPTPPVYLRDSMGNPVYDVNGYPVIDKGMDPNVSVFKGMVQSWYDAPYGFEEEMKEWSFGLGLEYWFKSNFSGRSGIYYENKAKGGRRYVTTGFGARFGYFGFDMGILIPFEERMFDAFNLRASVMLEIK